MVFVGVWMWMWMWKGNADILEYFRIADEGDGDAEPSLHATTVLAYRFVTETAVEQIYTLQGVFYCLNEGMHVTIKQKRFW